MSVLALGLTSMISKGKETKEVWLNAISPGLTSPSGSYRWLDVANNAYAELYRNNYSYEGAQVLVSFDAKSDVFHGQLDAIGLKPNFAYQLKLVGTPGKAGNHRLGLAGRWWEEEWLVSEGRWGDGWNLNNKGDGFSPTPNDETYFSRVDESDANSPTGRHYRYTPYLLFCYFITGPEGKAHVSFRANNSYHVLWKKAQRARATKDGPFKETQIDPKSSNPAYAQDHATSSVSVFGEWERLPKDEVLLLPGFYETEVILTEESFHGDGGEYAGAWASAMSAGIDFTITPPDTVPDDQNGNGIADAWERVYFSDIPVPPEEDTDDDGLTHREEYRRGTRPKKRDTDNDGQSDGWEIKHGLKPTDSSDNDLDPDDDSLNNAKEFVHGTDPRDADTDGDEMPDGWEVTYDLPPDDLQNATADTDGDGFSDLQEYKKDTNPRKYALVLQPGWNLISLARAPRNHEIANLFPNEKITASWCWNTDEQRYARNDKLWPLEGCWVYYDAEEATKISLSDKSFSSSADTDGDGLSDQQERDMDRDPHSYSITLTPGWNLVSLCRVPADNAVEAIFGNTTHPKAWTWENGQYKSKEVLRPLRGYWVYAVTSHEVEISISLP